MNSLKLLILTWQIICFPSLTYRRKSHIFGTLIVFNLHKVTIILVLILVLILLLFFLGFFLLLNQFFSFNFFFDSHFLAHFIFHFLSFYCFFFCFFLCHLNSQYLLILSLFLEPLFPLIISFQASYLSRSIVICTLTISNIRCLGLHILSILIVIHMKLTNVN